VQLLVQVQHQLHSQWIRHYSLNRIQHQVLVILTAMTQEEVGEEAELGGITHIPIQFRDQVRVLEQEEEEVDHQETTQPSPTLHQTVMPTLGTCTPISHYPNDQT
jgi:hypothetical protein